VYGCSSVHPTRLLYTCTEASSRVGHAVPCCCCEGKFVAALPHLPVRPRLTVVVHCPPVRSESSTKNPRLRPTYPTMAFYRSGTAFWACPIRGQQFVRVDLARFLAQTGNCSPAGGFHDRRVAESFAQELLDLIQLSKKS
jgi:hypothetical protein